jgi:hypothetical protein
LGIGGSGKAKEGDAGFCGSFKNGAHGIAGKSKNSEFPKTKTHRLRLIVSHISKVEMWETRRQSK